MTPAGTAIEASNGVSAITSGTAGPLGLPASEGKAVLPDLSCQTKAHEKRSSHVAQSQHDKSDHAAVKDLSGRIHQPLSKCTTTPRWR